MSFAMFVTWVLVGVLAGVLAGLVMKRGGFGLKKDITLGLVGSIGASWIFRAVGAFPEAGIVMMAIVASVGAAVPIIAQRKIWPTERPGDKKGAMWRWGLGAWLVAVVGWMILGPSSQPAATAAVRPRPRRDQPVGPTAAPVSQRSTSQSSAAPAAVISGDTK